MAGNHINSPQDTPSQNVHIGIVGSGRRQVKFKNSSAAKLNADNSRDGISTIHSGNQLFHCLPTQIGVRRPSVNNKEDVAIGKGRPGTCPVVSAAMATTGNVDDESCVPVKNQPIQPRLRHKRCFVIL